MLFLVNVDVCSRCVIRYIRRRRSIQYSESVEIWSFSDVIATYQSSASAVLWLARPLTEGGCECVCQVLSREDIPELSK